jgi:alpha/beta superfamily hydrolase
MSQSITPKVRRGLREILSLARVELEAGSEGVFEKSNGGMGRPGDVQAAIDWLTAQLARSMKPTT